MLGPYAAFVCLESYVESALLSTVSWYIQNTACLASCNPPRLFLDTVYLITHAVWCCRCFMLLAWLFLTHQIGICIYRVVATASGQIVVANAAGMLLLLCVFLMNGYVIRRFYIHPWVIW